MTTRMQMAFITSPSVTTKTPLGKLILETAAVQLDAEEKRIRIFQARKAQEREALEKDVAAIKVAIEEFQKEVYNE